MGVAGIVALFVWGPTVLDWARFHSPFDGLPWGDEVRALFALGGVVLAVLVVVKDPRRGNR